MKRILIFTFVCVCVCAFTKNANAQSTNLSLGAVEKQAVTKVSNNTTTTNQSKEGTIIFTTSLRTKAELNPRVLEKAKMLKEQDPEKYEIFRASPSNQKYVDEIEN